MNLNMSLKEQDDKFYCESIAKSISEIIRFSLDEEFRKSSFKLFGVLSTKETEKEISKRLMTILKNNSSKKRKKKLKEEKDKENLQEPKDISCSKDVNKLSTVAHNCESHRVDSQMIPQNFIHKNWLQISSQQYREAIKRRKLNYFSQPQFSHAHHNDIEFSTYNLHCSSSQPVSSFSDSCSSFNETTEFFHQESNHNTRFCQKMFTESFKDNAQKYLKKNSKFHKQSSF